MGLISGYADDVATGDNDRYLTYADDGTTKLTPASRLKTYLGFTTNPAGGWDALAYSFNTVVNNGNRSYTCTINGQNLSTVLSPGMRIRTQRTVAAPTQSTSLNGTTQYWSKTSPAGMTFTDDFVVSAWVKLTSYGSSVNTIISRYDAINGWILYTNGSGQVILQGSAGAGNNSSVTSYQSLPLNKWVHISAQLDMSAFTATTTTSYVMIDGVDVPASVTRGGTNPTALVQAGVLQVGAYNGANGFFPGKIAQAAVFSAKVTQATIQSYISQGLAGTETNLISAYSFNGTANDLNTTNANNLTANGSAVATNSDSPFGGQAGGTISSTLDYGIIQSVSFSTNTTVVVQVPEGCTIPTSGGVTAVSYSSNAAPYGFPKQGAKWDLLTHSVSDLSGTAVSNTATNVGNLNLNLPIGEWDLGFYADLEINGSTTSVVVRMGLGTTASNLDLKLTDASRGSSPTVTFAASGFASKDAVSLSASQIYYLNTLLEGATYNAILHGSRGTTKIYARNAYL